jgi:hypothetical protein
MFYLVFSLGLQNKHFQKVPRASPSLYSYLIIMTIPLTHINHTVRRHADYVCYLQRPTYLIALSLSILLCTLFLVTVIYVLPLEEMFHASHPYSKR